MKTIDILKHFPLAQSKFVEWLAEEIRINLDVLDQFEIPMYAKVFNYYLGYSTDTKPYYSMQKIDVQKEITFKFAQYELSLKDFWGQNDFLNYYSKLDYYQRLKKHSYMEIKQRSNLKIFNAMVPASTLRKKTIKDCLLSEIKVEAKRIKDCTVRIQSSTIKLSNIQDDMNIFWKQSIQWAWKIQKGEITCPF